MIYFVTVIAGVEVEQLYMHLIIVENIFIHYEFVRYKRQSGHLSM